MANLATDIPALLKALEERDAANAKLQETIARLQAQVAWLTGKLFGGRQSERFDPAQLPLALGEVAAFEPPPAPTQKVTYERETPKKRVSPEEAYANLPVDETVTIVPEAVQADPGAFEQIGEERTFEVDIRQPKLFKRDEAKRRWAHRRCDPEGTGEARKLCGPSTGARTTGHSRRSLPRHPCGFRPEGMPRPGWSPGSSSPSTSTTCRCTAWKR